MTTPTMKNIINKLHQVQQIETYIKLINNMYIIICYQKQEPTKVQKNKPEFKIGHCIFQHSIMQ